MLYQEHAGALESDFQRYYNINLPAALYGPQPISARRFATLTRWLPPDAAVWRATGSTWSTELELAAVTIEMLDSIRRLYIQSHVKKGVKIPEPIEIPRPWDREERARKSGTTLTEMIGLMKLPVRPRGDT